MCGRSFPTCSLKVITAVADRGRIQVTVPRILSPRPPAPARLTLRLTLTHCQWQPETLPHVLS